VGDPQRYLTIGISSRALFDLHAENQIFEIQGLEAYRKYQIEHEDDPLKPGAGFPLVKAILALNKPKRRQSEVVVMSRNNGDTTLRIFNSLRHYGLGIERAALTSGARLAKYLRAYNVDLFLSRSAEDVADALKAEVAAGLIYDAPADLSIEVGQIRIAFDGDAVLFSDEAQRVFEEQGLDAFFRHEQENARKPLPDGPFAKLLRVISYLQSQADGEPAPIRTALVHRPISSL
jgi:5'-nucleotidase